MDIGYISFVRSIEMRIALMTTRAHHRILEIDGEEVPGILVEGKPNIKDGGMEINNLFLPVLDCMLVHYPTPTVNGDEFCIASHVGIFRNEEGALFLGPSNSHKDKALCFIELSGLGHVWIPKRDKGPEYLHRIDFEKNDVYLLILKRGKKSIFVCGDIEHVFFYDYIGGHIEHKVRKMGS